MKQFKILINGVEATEKMWQELKQQHHEQQASGVLQHYIEKDANGQEIEIYNIITK